MSNKCINSIVICCASIFLCAFLYAGTSYASATNSADPPTKKDLKLTNKESRRVRSFDQLSDFSFDEFAPVQEKFFEEQYYTKK